MKNRFFKQHLRSGGETPSFRKTETVTKAIYQKGMDINMTQKPLYESIRASFSKDIYLPMCGAVAAPTVVWEVRTAEDLSALRCDTPPQNVILPVAPDLTVAGLPLYDVLATAGRSVPIFRIDSETTVAALARFTDLNHVGDGILCADYRRRDLLALAYEAMPMLRGMLDCRGLTPAIEKLPAEAVSHGATSVILDPAVATAEAVHSLQQRFIHVITADTRGFDTAAARGVNGILCADLEGAYAFLRALPEGTYLRRRHLIAHKGFQNNGKYTENTITSVVAAALAHFEGAEIDVKLTSDNIPVVMHNTNTKGLFDCEVAVTEESSYEFLSSLRRIGFPDESIDRFEDLMHTMKAYPDTPVLIEIKPSAKYHKVELLTALTDALLRDGKSQENCIGIMGGSLGPGLRYVHRRLPYLPLGWCEGGKNIPEAPTNRAEAEDRLYRVAQLTAGCAAGYNPEDVNINRMFNEYAKFRMLHVFVWSRSWTLSPSRWEVNGPANDQTYLSGFDAWTTDHGEKFLDYPVALEGIAPRTATSPVKPMCTLKYRDGTTRESGCGVLPLTGEVEVLADGTFTGRGRVRVMYTHRVELHFGESYRICSEPVEIAFS